MDGQAFSGHFQPMIGLPVLRRSRGHQHRASVAHTQMRHSVKSRPVSCHPDQCCGMSLTLFRARNGASDSRLVRVAADSAVKAPCAGSTAAGMPRSSQTGRQARAARDMRAAAGTRPCGRLLLSMQGTQTNGQRGAGGWRKRIRRHDQSRRPLPVTRTPLGRWRSGFCAYQRTWAASRAIPANPPPPHHRMIQSSLKKAEILNKYNDSIFLMSAAIQYRSLQSGGNNGATDPPRVGVPSTATHRYHDPQGQACRQNAAPFRRWRPLSGNLAAEGKR